MLVWGAPAPLPGSGGGFGSSSRVLVLKAVQPTCCWNGRPTPQLLRSGDMR